MAKLLPYLSDIYIQEGFTHQEVSNIIIGVHDETRGVSVRSVRRFCHEHNIRRGGPLIRKDHLHVAVNHVVNQVSSIGRSTFHEHQTYTKFMLHTIMGIHKYYYLSIQYSHIFQNATRLLWKVNIPPFPIENTCFLYLKDEIHKLAKITVFSPLDFSISENEITNARMQVNF